MKKTPPRNEESFKSWLKDYISQKLSFFADIIFDKSESYKSTNPLK